MHIIGLCGGSGSGKSSVSRIFVSCGYTIFDCDAVYHDLISSESACTHALADAFGKNILMPNGALNRHAMADLVFSDGSDAALMRKTLNQIAHHHVSLAFDAFCATNAQSNILIDAPLLFEAGMDKACDKTVAVIAPKDVRIKRIMSRDNISYEKACDRIATQLSDDILIASCDYHIDNSGTLIELENITKKIILQIKEDLGHE